LKLTPLDIHHKEFHRSIRGYNEEEVDVFLDEVADEFDRLFKENVSLTEQMEELKQRMVQYQTMEKTLQNTLFTAQKTAEEITNNSKKESELIMRDAELKAKDMIQQALAEKQRIQQIFLRIKQAEEEFRVRFKSLLDEYGQSLKEIPIPEDIMLLTTAPRGTEEYTGTGAALIIERPPDLMAETVEPEAVVEPAAASVEIEEEAPPEGVEAEVEAPVEPEVEAAAVEEAPPAADAPAEEARVSVAEEPAPAAAEEGSAGAADDSFTDALAESTGEMSAVVFDEPIAEASAEEPLLNSDVATVQSSDGSVKGLTLGEVGSEGAPEHDLPPFLRDPVPRTDEEIERLKAHGSATDFLAERDEDADIEEIS
jgi:cell division initiation protein